MQRKQCWQPSHEEPATDQLEHTCSLAQFVSTPVRAYMIRKFMTCWWACRGVKRCRKPNTMIVMQGTSHTMDCSVHDGTVSLALYGNPESSMTPCMHGAPHMKSSATSM